MIYRIIIICITVAMPFWALSQLSYSNSEASFVVAEKGERYEASCKLKKEVPGSRRLKQTQNRLRLKAVDLVGNYIIFEQLKIDHPQKNTLFQAFVDYSNLSFNAVIEKFSGSHWEHCESKRCITFWCKKSDFQVEDHYLNPDIDWAQILMLDFRRKKSISSACNLFINNELSPAEVCEMELLFLSGKAVISEDLSTLIKTNPGSQLENSLYADDSLMMKLTQIYQPNDADICHFGKMIREKALFTCASPSIKDSLYSRYLSHLGQCEGLWYHTQSFAAQHRDTTDFYGFDEATVFDMIGTYPLALNVFGLRIGYGGRYYQNAVENFGSENIQEALTSLQKEINFNGITPQALNLTGACYRLLNRPEKALAYLLLAYYLDNDAAYLTGNICLCLEALNYENISSLANEFLNSQQLDPWSKSQIQKLINP